jgi:hypothetical protein
MSRLFLVDILSLGQRFPTLLSLSWITKIFEHKFKITVKFLSRITMWSAFFLPSRHPLNLVRFEVLSAISVKVVAFWNVASCSLVKIDRRFRGAYSLPSSGRWVTRARKVGSDTGAGRTGQERWSGGGGVLDWRHSPGQDLWRDPVLVWGLRLMSWMCKHQLNITSFIQRNCSFCEELERRWAYTWSVPNNQVKNLLRDSSVKVGHDGFSKYS